MSIASKTAFNDWQADVANAETGVKDMNINDVFPSKYLKNTDLDGRKLKLIISSVEMEEIGTDQKPVLYFEGKKKGLVLNKTKGAVLAASFSPETDGWIGKEIAIFPGMVSFQGQMVPSINVEVVAEFSDLEGEVPF